MPDLHTPPDEDLRTAVLTQLAADPRTNAADLRVGVLNGVAHLAGRVDTLQVREAAEEIARSVACIRGVVNRIDAPGAPSPARAIDLHLDS